MDRSGITVVLERGVFKAYRIYYIVFNNVNSEEGGDGIWKRGCVVSGKNRSIKVSYALIQRVAKPVDAYRYEIRYYEGRKVKYEPVATRPGPGIAG